VTDPTITAAAHTVYDSESGRWCCTVCEQWSDEGGGLATLVHLDHPEATDQSSEDDR
jgi:hypothetical protein